MTKFILLILLSFTAEGFEIESFKKENDCKDLNISYELQGRNIVLNFIDPFVVSVMGEDLKRNCLIYFEVSSLPGIPSSLSFEYSGKVRTSEEVKGKIASDLRYLGSSGSINVLKINEGTEIDLLIEREQICYLTRSLSTLVFRIDSSLRTVVLPYENRSYIEIHEATLKI